MQGTAPGSTPWATDFLSLKMAVIMLAMISINNSKIIHTMSLINGHTSIHGWRTQIAQSSTPFNIQIIKGGLKESNLVHYHM